MTRHALAIPREYLLYWRLEPVTRGQVGALLDELELDLHGRDVLDLGPAIGASLVEFRKRGATAQFVERHPVFYLECRRRGFKGRRGDFMQHPDLVPERFDVLYARGSTTGSTFSTKEALQHWLRDLQARGRTLLICPWRPFDGSDFTAEGFAELGFRAVQALGNATPIYPYTWVWGVDAPAP